MLEAFGYLNGLPLALLSHMTEATASKQEAWNVVSDSDTKKYCPYLTACNR